MNTNNQLTQLEGAQEWLRSATREDLHQILLNRPGAAYPQASDFLQFALRLGQTHYVVEAIRCMRALPLAVMRAAADLELAKDEEPSSAAEVAERLGLELKAVLVAMKELNQAGLIFGDRNPDADSRITMLGQPHGILAHHFDLPPIPTDRCIPAGEYVPQSDGGVPASERLEMLNAKEARVIEALGRIFGMGTSEGAGYDADPELPVPRLLNMGLLFRFSEDVVGLSAGAQSAREGRDIHAVPFLPPNFIPAEFLPKPEHTISGKQKIPANSEAQDTQDRNAVGSSLEVARAMVALINALAREQVPLLKKGSIGVRPARKLAEELDLSMKDLARLLCLGLSAGLISRGEPQPLPMDDTGGEYVAPTPRAYSFLEQSLAEQVSYLLSMWVSSDAAAWRVEGDVRIFDEAMFEGDFVALRRPILLAYCRSAEGCALSEEEFYQGLLYVDPWAERCAEDAEAIAEIRAEAVWMGVLAETAEGRVAATRSLRILCAETLAKEAELVCMPRPVPAPFNVRGQLDQELLEHVESIVPATVDKIIPQADMTILAPGPLPPAMQKELSLLAQIESPGMASVWRISPESIRRGLESGRTGAEILHWFEENSMGELPQALSYLIKDQARAFGVLRGGPAGCYVRADDEATIAEIMGLPEAKELGLEQIAPSVIVSLLPLGEVMKVLAKHGLSPAMEAPSGQRISALALEPYVEFLDDWSIRNYERSKPKDEALTAEECDHALHEMLVAEDGVAKAKPGKLNQVGQSTSVIQALIDNAIHTGRDIFLTYRRANGERETMMVDPQFCDDEAVTVWHMAAQRMQQIALERIVDVSFKG